MEMEHKAESIHGEISASHGNKYEDGCLLGYALSSGRN
jgi:hypothetical protein